MLAGERGEVHGRCGFGWDSVVLRCKEAYEQKKLAVLVQLGLAKHPDIPKRLLAASSLRRPER